MIRSLNTMDYQFPVYVRYVYTCYFTFWEWLRVLHTNILPPSFLFMESSQHPLSFFYFFLRFYVFTFRERGREREREGENIDVREKYCLVASPVHPDWGANLGPRNVPCPGIQGQSFALWGYAQPSGQHWPGQHLLPSLLYWQAKNIMTAVHSWDFSIFFYVRINLGCCILSPRNVNGICCSHQFYHCFRTIR